MSSLDLLLPPKTPPYSLQAEQAVLGGLMLDASAWEKIADSLCEEDFYRKEHRLIFRAITELIEAQFPCDGVTVAEVLEKRGELKEAGGMSYLAALLEATPSAANIIAYAAIVRERAILRQLAHVGTEIVDAALNPRGLKVSAILEEAEQKVFRIADQRGRSGGFKAIKHILTQTVDRIEQLHEAGGSITGVSTGFIDLDKMTAGLQPGDLIIVAGRPSMGKTAFAMCIAEHVAIKERLAVAVFSMEMPAEHLVMRMLSSLGRIDQHRLRIGQLDSDEWPQMTSAVNLLAATALFIDDTPALTPLELRARARRLAREQKLGLVVIDYLQLMQAPGAGDNRVAEISEISRSLKALAKELNVPVVALSQLNRNLEQRPNKRPVMSDLRESGSIEQDADLILFIYRDEVYHEDTPDKGIAEIIIAKQRNGPIGTVRLTFLSQYTKFENFADDSYEDHHL
jgi:replicative DNA helicase